MSTKYNQNTTIDPPKIEYCLYARKSSESDERQTMSIDSQIEEMLALAKRDNLKIKEIKKESHSAKISGSRPVFTQLLQELRQKKFNGILTWAPDRLSRNAGDLGSVVDLNEMTKNYLLRMLQVGTAEERQEALSFIKTKFILSKRTIMMA